VINAHFDVDFAQGATKTTLKEVKKDNTFISNANTFCIPNKNLLFLLSHHRSFEHQLPQKVVAARPIK